MSFHTSGLFHAESQPCVCSVGRSTWQGHGSWGHPAAPWKLFLSNPAELSHLAQWQETETSYYNKKLSLLASFLFSCIFLLLASSLTTKVNLLQVSRKPIVALIPGPISSWKVERGKGSTAPVGMAWCYYFCHRKSIIVDSLFEPRWLNNKVKAICCTQAWDG